MLSLFFGRVDLRFTGLFDIALPAALPKPVVGEANLRASVAFGLGRIGIDCADKFLGGRAVLDGPLELLSAGGLVSTPIRRIGGPCLLEILILLLLARVRARRWFLDGFRMVWGS